MEEVLGGNGYISCINCGDDVQMYTNLQIHQVVH